MKVTVNWEQRMTFEADTESGHKVKISDYARLRERQLQ